MLIPLLGLSVAGVIEEQRSEAARFQMRFANEHAQFHMRARELWNACTGPEASMLVVSGVDVRACRIDGVPLHWATPARYVESAHTASTAYRGGGPSTVPPQGVFAMCPGLHRIELPESPTPTYVLLHPREARSVSFDAFTRGFGVDRKAAEAEAVAEAANGTLFDYNAWVANSRMQNPAGQTSRDALDACAKWLEQARQVIVKGVPVKAFEVATSARAALVGTPVSSFAELTDYVGFHVFDLQSKGLLTEARTLLDVGLLMLPDAPTLLAIQGEMLLQNGDSAGLDLLERALEREAWMPDAMRDRARNLLPASA